MLQIRAFFRPKGELVLQHTTGLCSDYGCVLANIKMVKTENLSAFFPCLLYLSQNRKRTPRKAAQYGNSKYHYIL